MFRAGMFRAACVVALCMAAISAALAQGYPNKPIRLMIGYAPGGSAEAGARPLARALEPLLGQPLVFEYRPGNAGGVAMEAIARAPNDGYTLYYFDSGPAHRGAASRQGRLQQPRLVHPPRPRLRQRQPARGASVHAVQDRRPT